MRQAIAENVQVKVASSGAIFATAAMAVVVVANSLIRPNGKSYHYISRAVVAFAWMRCIQVEITANSACNCATIASHVVAGTALCGALMIASNRQCNNSNVYRY